MAKLKPSSVMVQVQPMESEGQKGRIRAELPHVFCCLEHTLLSQLAQDSGFQFDRTLLSIAVYFSSTSHILSQTSSSVQLLFLCGKRSLSNFTLCCLLYHFKERSLVFHAIRERKTILSLSFLKLHPVYA